MFVRLFFHQRLDFLIYFINKGKNNIINFNFIKK